MLHIYTGDGKGKTTAAFGLALRAAGHGKGVMIVQFLKGSVTGEVLALSAMPGIRILRNQREYGFVKNMDASRRAACLTENTAHLMAAKQAIRAEMCQMLVLDEAIPAYNLNMLDRPALDSLLENASEIEIVLTGRDAPAHFLQKADYISNISKEKHPFDKGVTARKGVEF